MLGSLPQGLFFLEKNDIPENLRHAHFEEKTIILLIFCENIDIGTQRDSQEALSRASEGSRETLKRLLEAISVSKASDQLCKP